LNEIPFIERKYLNKEKKEQLTFTDILKNEISIILGEPASGKTFQFEQYEKENKNSELVELITLDLQTDIIADNIEIVLLDSIDEALSKNDSDKKFKKLLIQYIQKCRVINPKVKFVISCRFVEWKEQFEEALRELDKELTLYYIEDLSREEINQVLVACNIKKDDFWHFIESNYLEELLKNIMMVLHLIKHFADYKNRKLKYFEIYQLIINEHLSFKTTNERCENFDRLNLENRLKIASIVAIYMVLNRTRDISIDDFDKLSSCMYKLEGIELTGESLKIVFDTSLFKGKLLNTRFFHKSIQEYLSANFIIERKLDIQTIKNIFSYDTSFYEEFEEMIIYLTNIEEKFFKHFVSFDPVIFRRHPYLKENEQKILLVKMLNIVQVNGHKVWSKWEYLDDGSLVKFKDIDNISSIILDNVNISNVSFELFMYISGILKNNYSKNLENVFFKILENIKNDKRKFQQYISSFYMDNTNYNLRLFEFLRNNNLISKDDKISIRVFGHIYKKRDFNEIKILLRYFSTYTDKKLLNKIDINDVSILVDEILSTYDKRVKKYPPKQLSFLFFLIIKKNKELKNKKILENVFQALIDCKIYEFEFNISDHEEDEYKLDFNDINEEFSDFLFKEDNKNGSIHNLKRMLKFYDMKKEDIINISKKYPIKDYKDKYLLFRRINTDIDNYLLTDTDFKTYLEELEEKHRKLDKELYLEDRPYKRQEKRRKRRKKYIYGKAIDNLRTTSDIIYIYFHKEDTYEDDFVNINNRLKKDLRNKYSYFMKILIDKFKKDRVYLKIEENITTASNYYISRVFSYVFNSISSYKINKILATPNEYKKLLLHMIGIRDTDKDYFIKISFEFRESISEIITDLFVLSLEQSAYKNHIFNYHVKILLEKLNLYNKESLFCIIEKIKEIDKEVLVKMNNESKKELLDLVSLDKSNYSYIKDLLLINKSNYNIYFDKLFSIKVNRAFSDFKELFHISNHIYLIYYMGINTRITNKNDYDKHNVCPLSRNNFIKLVYIIYHRYKRDQQQILENLSDTNIEFILDTYYKMFNKYQHPLGVYSPDIYEDMNDLTNQLFKIIGEEQNRLDLLIKLKDNESTILSERAKYQIDNIKNLQLKDREFDNLYYKKMIDTSENKEEIFFNYEKLESDLTDISLILFDSRHSIFSEEEDLINDRYRDALKHKKYDVLDQSRGGESKSTKKVGERDLLIQNTISKTTETVLEGFILHSNSNDVITGHYEKLIKKYDVYGNKKNYMLAYCKVNNFHKLCENYKINFESFEEVSTEKSNIYIGITKENSMEIVHFLLNFYSEKKIL